MLFIAFIPSSVKMWYWMMHYDMLDSLPIIIGFV